MKKWITALTGIPVFVISLNLMGCTPMPYQGCYPETEVIVIYEPVPVPVPVPVPYPDPVEVDGSAPLPTRHTPLTKPQESGNPRIKTPRGGRSDEGTVIARGGDRPVRNPGRTKGRPSTKPGTRGR